MKKKVFLILLFVVLLTGISGCKFIEDDYILMPEKTLEGKVSQKDDQEWLNIESFLHLITKEEIPTIKEFYLFGSEPGYEKVASRNYGYLPFYQNNRLNIIDEIVPISNKDIRPGVNRTKTKYIVIHNTGMASPVMTAARLSASINNSRRQASWHFTIDDNDVFQQLYLDEIGWHAGSQEGNNYGIGLEMAVYEGIDLNRAMRNTAKLTAYLMDIYNLELTDVLRHYDFSGKHCPQVLMEAGRWEEFLELVKIEYYGQKYFSEVDFNWKSLTPDLLDNQGRVISQNGSEAIIKYEVKINYNGEERVYQFTSKLEKMI